MSERDLTVEELNAIRRLKRLARDWPASLKLFSANGSLVVVHTMDNTDEDFAGHVLDRIEGIPNDGGDPR